MTNRPQTQTRMPTDSGQRDDPRDDPRRGSRPWTMLVLATIGFAVNFWAWALLSPLGPKFKDVLHLSPFEQALVVGDLVPGGPDEAALAPGLLVPLRLLRVAGDLRP